MSEHSATINIRIKIVRFEGPPRGHLFFATRCVEPSGQATHHPPKSREPGNSAVNGD